MAATTSSSSSSCSSFFSLRSTSSIDPRVRTQPQQGCSKLDGVAMWFINGVAAAFFASLERCSCIRIATVDDGEEANDVPLIHSDGNMMRHDSGTTSRRRTGKGKKGRGAFLED